MALLRLDETVSIIGNGTAKTGPVAYADRWHINNLILDYVTYTDEVDVPDIAVYRNYVEARNLIMRSDLTDSLNTTVVIDTILMSGESIVLSVNNGTGNGTVSLHIMGNRYVQMMGYPEQYTYFG